MKKNHRLLSFIFSAWALALALYVPPVEAAKKSVRTTSLCAARLSDALNGKNPPSRENLSTLKDYLEAQARMSAKLQVEWATLNRDGIRADENFFWMRENGIKDVNTIAGIALTERYLLLKAWHLTRILEENPSWGRLVHRNFKDAVIVTKLKPEELSKRIEPELRKALERDMFGYNNHALSYLNMLLSNTKIGFARTFEGAHLKANGFDINTWHKETSDIRQSIKTIWESQYNKEHESSTHFLIAIYKIKKKNQGAFNAATIQKILRDLKVNGKDIRSLSLKIEKYFQLIQGADMLPPPDMIPAAQLAQLEAWLKSGGPITTKIQSIISRRPWTQRHALFYKTAYEQKTSHVLALDIRGFGTESFAIRDVWILNEQAQRRDLRRVYEDSTKWLDAYFKNLIEEIRANTGVQVITNFRSGDDALFAFHPSTSKEDAKKVTKYLREKRKDLYFSLASKEQNSDSLSLLIEKARVGINTFKEAEEAAARERPSN